MKNIFNIKVLKHEKNNKKFLKEISDESYHMLKKLLNKDYIIINKMYKKGWISKKQYEILNK